jgi:hypothetical protein
MEFLKFNVYACPQVKKASQRGNVEEITLKEAVKHEKSTIKAVKESSRAEEKGTMQR